MLKKIFLLIVSTCILLNLNAQEKNNIKLAIETGILPLSEDSENLGLFLNLEPKIKVSKNIFMGLRVGLTLNSHSFKNNDNAQFQIADDFDNAILSFVPTLDYYLYKNDFTPYLGFGLGYYLLPHSIELFPIDQGIPNENAIEGDVKNRVGFLLRGGIERGILRFGLEYSFILKADIEISDNKSIGTVDNSYFGLSVGLTFGGNQSSE